MRLISLVFLILIFVFIRGGLGKWLVKDDQIKSGDVIVVLMGSISDRVLQAADIYNEGKFRRVLMVETAPSANLEFIRTRGAKIITDAVQCEEALISLGVPEDSITILNGWATSTLMESQTVRDYIKVNQDIDTLVLVSSAEHMRRASIIFSKTLRKADLQVEVFSSPSKYSSFSPQEWYRNKDGVEQVATEYIKLLYFYLFEKRKIKSDNDSKN